MDTATHDALLNAILANPEQDLPRLVYADFLEENDGLTGVCKECNGAAKITDFERHVFVGKYLPSWWHTATHDARNRVSYCFFCQGSGKVSNLFAERAEFIRLMCDIPSGKSVRRVRELHNRNHYLWFPTGLESSLYKLTGNNPSHVITRGFISEVQCPIGWWVGETCGVCDGTGHSFGELWGSQNDCAYCGGLGGTVVNGPVMVKSHPVDRVTLTDRSPVESEWGWWYRQSPPADGDDPHSVPPDVFHLLGSHAPSGGRSFTAADTEWHLSNALLTWARLNLSE